MKCYLIRFIFALFLSYIPLHAVDVDAATINQFAHNNRNWPGLHYAIDSNRPDVARIFLGLFPEQATQLTPDSALWSAHMGNDASGDYDIYKGSEKGFSALELAIRKKQADLVAPLIELGADPNLVRKEYAGGMGFLESGDQGKFVRGYRWSEQYEHYSPLYWAIQSADENIVGLLLEQTVNTEHIFKHQSISLSIMGETYSIDDKSALKCAIQLDNDAILRKIIFYQMPEKFVAEDQIDASILDLFKSFELNLKNWPALHYALSIDDLAAFEVLLNYGANYVEKYQCPYSLLQLAVENENPMYLQLMLERGADKSVALLEAVKKNNYPITQFLVNQGANHDDALLSAIKNKNFDIVQLLVNEKSYDCRVIREAVLQQDYAIVEFLLKKGFGDDYPFKTLATAIQMQNLALVKLLWNHHFWYHNPQSVELSIAAGDEVILRFIFEQGLKDPAAYVQCVNANRLDLLMTVIEYQGLTKIEHEKLKKLAITQKRTEILNYLLNMNQFSN